MYAGQSNGRYYANVFGGNYCFGCASGHSCESVNEMFINLGRQLIVAFESNNKKINFIF
jgi:hypothetical protein